MADWSPPESDFQESDWSPPEGDFAPPTNSAAVSTDTPFQDSWGSQLKHQGAQVLKGAANAVAALPMAAADAGVGARNMIGDAYNKAVGNPATPDYELPSTTWRKGMDQVFGAPENTMEKVNDVVLPMLMGSGAASSEAPAAVRAVMAGPEAANTVPSNFVNPAGSRAQQVAQTVQKGQDIGLVVPPQTTNPSAFHTAVETVGGKIQTQQAAAIHNEPAATTAAVQDLTQAGAKGLNPDAPLTEGSLRQVIKEAGQGYQAVRNVGQITVGPKYLQTLADVADQASGPAASFPGSKVSPLVGEVDSLLQPSFDASHAVDKIAELRDASTVAFQQGDSRLSSGYRQLAGALEDQIDEGISQKPGVDPDTIANFRASRVLAAKAHSVLDAFNPERGTISIQSLAKSDAPLTGNLKTIADFGNMAPKATQDASKVGSHGVSHLDTLGTMFTSAFGEHVAGPWGAAAGLAYPAARVGARAYALGPGQAGAVPQAIVGGVSNPKTAAAATQGIAQGTAAIERASGGKVDINSLVEKLIRRWKEAKKQTDNATKPLLRQPDSVIAKALSVAQEHI